MLNVTFNIEIQSQISGHLFLVVVSTNSVRQGDGI